MGRNHALPKSKEPEFKARWNRGELAKTIGTRMGLGVVTVYNTADRLDLEPRRPGGYRYKHSFLVKLDDELRNIIRRRSSDMGMYQTNYIRQLIHDDALKHPNREG